MDVWVTQIAQSPICQHVTKPHTANSQDHEVLIWTNTWEPPSRSQILGCALFLYARFCDGIMYIFRLDSKSINPLPESRDCELYKTLYSKIFSIEECISYID